MRWLVIPRQTSSLRGQYRQLDVVTVIRKFENDLEVLQPILHAVPNCFLAIGERERELGVVCPFSRLHVIRKREGVLHEYSHS